MPFDSILDEFEDPPTSENPLYEGGRWGPLPGSILPELQKFCFPGPDCTVTDSLHGPTNYSVWMQDTWDTAGGVPIEAWACIEGGQLGAALETWRVALWSSISEWDGYLAYFGGAIGKSMVLRRYDNGEFIQIAEAGAPAYPSQIGIRINGTEIESWANFGSGMVLMSSVTDLNYRGRFWGSIGVEDPTGGGLGISCFGALVENEPELIRWNRYRQIGPHIG